MERMLNEKCDYKQLSPLTLAFVGDTVFDLFVRESLVCNYSGKVNSLHKMAVNKVNAGAQAKWAHKLMPILSEEEISVLKRGRNAHTKHVPKNADESDYHYATGLEALFGYLYLAGNIERLRELFTYIEKGEDNAQIENKQEKS